MQYVVYEVSTGRIRRHGKGEAPPPPPDGMAILEIGGDPHGCYVLDGELVERPPKPTPFHKWNWASKQWEADIERAIEARSEQISDECERRHNLPVAYLGALFDADAVARENISRTHGRIARGDGLPAGWVGWRDFDNGVHWGEDAPEDVMAHLAALMRAIEDRRQALYIASWTHKQAVSTAPSVQAVIDHDIAAGWPDS